MAKLIFSFVVLRLLIPVSILHAQSVKLNSSGANETLFDFHVVEKGETLYSLSKQYNTTVEDLQAMNPAIVDNTLSTGGKIKVPLSESRSPVILSTIPVKPIYHTVQHKETLYAISKKYDTRVDSLLIWNKLSNPDIEEGASIIVAFENASFQLEGPLSIPNKTDELTVPPFIISDSVIQTTAITNAMKGEENATFPDDAAEKGIATWVKSGDDAGDFFALHPSAPKGTEISVKNMMNGKIVVVKVIGKLPAISANENVMIKISASAAKELGVLDERFLAAMYYEGLHDHDSDNSSNDLK